MMLMTIDDNDDDDDDGGDNDDDDDDVDEAHLQTVSENAGLFVASPKR